MTYPHWDDDDTAFWHQQQLEEEQQEKEMKARAGIGGGGFDPIPAGVHRAVCTGVVDLGMQPSFNPAYKPNYKLLLTFELPDELTDDGEPRLISDTQTASMSKKANLRKIVESWYSKSFPDDEAAGEFDLRNLLGRPAFISVIHKSKGDKTYANISSVSALPKSAEKPEPKGDLIYYSEAGDQSLEERSAAYAKLPEWIQKKIDQQLRASPVPATPEGQFGADDDIPF